MRYPTAPHRPQAYRVRFVGRRRVHVHATSTWYGCLAALAVVATVAALAASAGIEGTKPTTMLAAPAAPPRVPGASGAAAGPSTPAAATGSLARQGRQLDVQLTAYAASVEEGTAWGITRSGTRARSGVVAVDPAVIPLGSRLRIAGLPGTYRAEDTGGGIRGAQVSVFMASRLAALQFGHRPAVAVEVLGD